MTLSSAPNSVFPELARAGYPTEVVVLDFETYFDESYSLRKLSTVEFIADPQFEVLLLAVHDGTSPRWYAREAGVAEAIKQLQRQYGPHLERCTVVAQNARFDGMILARHYDIVPKYFVDLLGMARHWSARNRNDLGALAKRLGLGGEKGDTLQFKGLTNRVRVFTPKGRNKTKQQRPLLTAETEQAFADYAIQDVVLERQAFECLLPRLSCPQVELPIITHTLRMYFRPTLTVDTALATSLQDKMRVAISEEVSKAGVTESAARSESQFTALLSRALTQAGDDPLRYMKPTKRPGSGQMFDLSKLGNSRAKLLGHSSPTVCTLMKARIAVKSWPLHIARVKRIVDQAQAAGGRLPVPLNYYGAHTGRWSGGEKLNLQNLGSRGHSLVNKVRELLCAPPGRVLVITDASQIEARVLAWVARQDDLVEKFRTGSEIYCEFATEVLGWEVRKPLPDDLPPIAEHYKWARNSVGKVGILGCGYGMGAGRAVDYAAGSITLEHAEKLVATYRKKNDKIVRLWRNLERAFIRAARYHTEATLGPPGGSVVVAPGTEARPCDVRIILPSGRELYYHKVRVQDSNGYMSASVWSPLTKTWMPTWGGALTENLVQAISRDILWGGVARMEAAGYPVVHHVHDELIACVILPDADDALATSIRALSIPPVWGPGLPLGAEGCITNRYGGH